MTTETKKLNLVQKIALLKNNKVLNEIESILEKNEMEEHFRKQAKIIEKKLGIKQKPMTLTVDLEKLAREQNYKTPKKEDLILDIEDDISFEELIKMIGK